MKKPIVIINFKTYKQGEDVLKLAKTIESVDKSIIVGVQAMYLKEVSDKTKLAVYAEHVDPYLPGRNTGFILPEDVKAAGADGVFLNHSEHRLDFRTVKETVQRCKKLKLKICIFAKDLNEAKKMKKLNPDFLAIEPPELVGGNISVSTAKPGLIKRISASLGGNFLVGAGIKDYNDVKTSMELGASGIAVASGITKAKNPKKAVKDLIGISKRSKK